MPKIDGLVTFLYYDDLAKAVRFYTEIMGLKVIIDQGWAKILKLSSNSNIGLVDGKKGSLKPTKSKPVMITILVPDVDMWYNHLKKLGVETMNEPHDEQGMNLRQFMFKDPEGYVIEIQHFY
jgi:predicted enzyme related to lactoylglutathione lyase